MISRCLSRRVALITVLSLVLALIPTLLMEGGAGAATGTVDGRLTDAATGDPLVDICAFAISSDGSTAGSATTGDDGTYTLQGLLAGQTYKILFTDPSGSKACEWYKSPEDYAGTWAEGTEVTTGDTGIDADLDKGMSISGVVKGAESGLPGLPYIVIRAYDSTKKVMVRDALTNPAFFVPDGYYNLPGLHPGVGYKVYFYPHDGVHQNKYWNATAPPVLVDTWDEVTEPVLAGSGSIIPFLPVGWGMVKGKVTFSGSGRPAWGCTVSVYETNSGRRVDDVVYVDSLGNYSRGELPLDGDYKILFKFADGTLGAQWYKAGNLNGAGNWQDASSISVDALFPTVPDTNTALVNDWASISGIVTSQSSGLPIADCEVLAYDSDSPSRAPKSTTTDSSGNFKLSNLESNRGYKILLSPATDDYATEWFMSGRYGAYSWSSAETVTPGRKDIYAGLDPGASITGKVLGVPPEGCKVQVYDIVGEVTPLNLYGLVLIPPESPFQIVLRETEDVAPDGTFTIGGLHASIDDAPTNLTDVKYKICYRPKGATKAYAWYRDSGDWGAWTDATRKTMGTDPGTAAVINDTTLNAAGSIKGRVTDSSLAPIEGCRVKAYEAYRRPAASSLEFWLPDAALAGEATTDNSGNYEIKPLRQWQRYKLLVTPPNGPYADEWYNDKTRYFNAAEVTAAAVPSSTDIQLEASTTITGKVTARGEDLGGCKVRAYSDNYDKSKPDPQKSDQYVDYKDTLVQEVETSASGEYSLTVRPGTNYRISFDPGSLAPGSLWYSTDGAGYCYFNNADITPTNGTAGGDPVAAGSTNINADLRLGEAIEGQVTGSGPVAGCKVEAYGSQMHLRSPDPAEPDNMTKDMHVPLVTTTTNASGNYRLTGLTEGTEYSVKFTPNDGVHPIKWFENTTPAPTLVDTWSEASDNPVVAPASGINAALPVGYGSISGRVSSAEPGNPPIEDCLVTAFDCTSGIARGTDFTDDSGFYKIGNLKFGDPCKLLFSPADGNHRSEYFDDKGTYTDADPVSAGAVGSDNVNAVLELKMGAISGEVTHGAAKLQEVRVFAYEDSDPPTIGGTATTRVDGKYSIGSLKSDRQYKLLFIDPDGTYACEWHDNQLSFGAAEPVTPTTNLLYDTGADLEDAVSITGHVTTPGPVPLTGCRVKAYDATADVFLKEAVTDAGGAYDLDGLHDSSGSPLYKVAFYPGDNDITTVTPEWYENAENYGAADAVDAPSTADAELMVEGPLIKSKADGGITPASHTNDGSVNCTIKGAHFYRGAGGVKILLRRPDFSVSPTGYKEIATVGAPVVDSSGEQATCHFDLDGAETCFWDVYVENNFADHKNATLPAGFEVKQTAPAITGISPSKGMAGDRVTISGSHFGPDQGYVIFNGKYATEYTSWKDTKIECVVPYGASEGPVQVKNAGGASNTVYFKVLNTPEGDNVTIPLGDGVEVWFEEVITDGETTVTRKPDPSIEGYRVVSRTYCDIMTTVVYNGRVRVTLQYDDTGLSLEEESRLFILHKEGGVWVNRTMSRDIYQNTITAEVSGLSEFVVALPTVHPTWYLPEGSTDWGFSTYISIENPNNEQVTARITYMKKDGSVSYKNVFLPALSQTTINPKDELRATDFSTKVECAEGKTIAVDRTMTWTGTGAKSLEAHSSVGVTSHDLTWYLPEGSSSWGFECWLLIQNPTTSKATCYITYMIEGEGAKTVGKEVGPNTRATFNMADDIGQKDASIKVESNVPVIPERAMYRHNRREGHDSIGTTAPLYDYYLAEGTTAWGFTTYVLVQNPNPTAANVTVTYMTPSGAKAQPAFQMPPNSRKTIRVNDALPGTDLSTRVHADQPIIAERAMYWDNGAGEACHDSIGMAAPHTTFYLPDGQTSNGAETWTLVQNPNDSSVEVEISYLTSDGRGNVTFPDTLAPNSRKTYNMADKGISGRAAIMVTSKTVGKKIMAERAMYWNSRGAGTDTIGGFSD